jgi:hypothetical protein
MRYTQNSHKHYRLMKKYPQKSHNKLNALEKTPIKLKQKAKSHKPNMRPKATHHGS